MRILLVDVDGWFYGRPVFVHHTARYLHEEGIAAAVAGAVGVFRDRLVQAGIESIPLGPMWRRLETSPASIANLAKAIDDYKPDIIHSHGISENLVCTWLGRRRGVPVLPTFHTIPFDRWRHEKSWGLRLKRLLYEILYLHLLDSLFTRRNPLIMAVSSAVAENLHRLGYRQDRLRIIHFGIDPTLRGQCATSHAPAAGLPPSTAVFKLVMVGRLTPDKGCDDLLAAISSLQGVSVWFVGDGDIAHYRALAESLLLGDRVSFLGFRDDVPSILRAADGFVLPSHGEAMGLSLLEAMAEGLPSIVTDVGGMPEAVRDTLDGFVVPPRDVPALTAAIDRLRRLPAAQRKDMGARAQARVSDTFSRKRMVNSLLCVYHELIRL